MSYTAKDVKTLRDTTGAGMMDCKKALEENSGNIDEAKQWLREKGLAASAKRDDRDNNQGVVALVIRGNVGAMAKLKCETDFVAGSDAFKAELLAIKSLSEKGHKFGIMFPQIIAVEELKEAKKILNTLEFTYGSQSKHINISC